ncbi:eukaryotic membrane protein (cytomegalovirus gH-receptor) family protein, putative (macronuclear) [Tetrahymena thermophila SB210]|uniref:Eukaryotic membrane protein (Cytomegalovirus gH-receptor) family protein, putative n=1 Tax=Tetrahymena thermophila (strain SB210) TaxID=312017 RepID=Q22ST9_TETTS|nr:eukaryotic membrane protein (cytomegalovirus gH-receptor) family protein, putative [Tetrahymena thermophila SB210]EAR88375.2 eukaryotic membrane protein (cytomegalovirus gH-receptor) family protein, putative [Tetrahymena thermophila SB210]|eukprot:XP_001008620.2 eukaryotic membrane protein (cytomegalovirus gH-receptor) family protein, putative [Tetrahymena thermophila SB210]
MLKIILKPIYLLVSLFFIQATVLWVFWEEAIPNPTMNQEKQDQISNPYLSEMKFKDDLQKSYYEESWFPKQTEKVALIVISDFGLNDLIYCKKDKVKQCANFNLSRNPFYFFNNDMEEFYKNEKEKTLITQLNQDFPLHEEYKLQSLLSGNYIGFRDYLNNSFSHQTDFDSLLFQSKKQNKGQSYLISDFNDKIVKNINQDHYNDTYYKQEVHSKQEFLKLQKEEGQNFIFYYQRINETFLHLQQHFKQEESNSDQIIYDYFNQSVSLILDSFNQSKQLNTNITILSVGQFGFINQTENMEVIQNASKGFILAYDNRKFLGNQIKSVVQNNYQYQVTSYDISATISALTGQPLTKNNIGIMIPQYFLDIPQIDNYVLANNFYTNFRHVEDLYNSMQNKNKQFSYDELDGIEQITQQVRLNYKDLFINDKINDKDQLFKFLKSAVIYIQEIRSVIKQEMITPDIDILQNCFYVAILNLAIVIIAIILINYYQQQITTQIQFKNFSPLQSTFMIVLLFLLALSSAVFTYRNFSSFVLLACGTFGILILSQLFYIIYNKQEPFISQLIYLLVIIKKLCKQINFEKTIDFLVFLSALFVASYSQVSQENMSSYSLYIRQLLIAISIIYALYFGFLLFKKNDFSSTNKKIEKNIFISIALFIISIYLQHVFSQKQLLLQKYHISQNLQMIGSSILHIALFFYLVIKQIKSVSSEHLKRIPKNIYFILQSILILFSLAYYMCFISEDFSNEELSNGYTLQSLFVFLIYLTFTILCLYQFFVIKEKIGKLWNCSSFLINFVLFSISNLDKSSFLIVQLFFIALISYGNIVYSRQQICFHSKYSVLFLLSVYFYLQTGHSYELNDLFQKFLVQSSPFQQSTVGFQIRVLINIVAGFIYACLVLPFFCITDTSLNFLTSQDTSYFQKSFFQFMFDCSIKQSEQNSFQIIEMEQASLGQDSTKNEQIEQISDSPKNKAQMTQNNILHLTFCSSNLKFQLPILLSLLTLVFFSIDNLQQTSTITHFFPGILFYGLVFFSVTLISFLQYLILKYDEILLKQFKVK